MMGKTKISSHWYSTRSKIPKMEEQCDDSEQQELDTDSLIKSMGESPSAIAKFRLKSEYASPSNRPSTISQNDNEVEWDLTSPSAMKYQVLFSDKKSSTPTRNLTPTRKFQLRPRSVLCKKNIARSTIEDSYKVDFVNELAALNDMVNSEQAQIVTEDKCSDNQCVDSRTNPSSSSDVNTSDIFTDDSFFSESILLNTQAMESEAVIQQVSSTNVDLKKYDEDSIFFQPLNSGRKSFQLENEDNQYDENSKIERPLFNEPKLHSSSDFSRSKMPSHNLNEKHLNSLHTTGNVNIVQKPSLCHPLNFSSQCTRQKNPTISKPNAKTVLDVPKVVGVSAKAIHQHLPQQHDGKSLLFCEESKPIEQPKGSPCKPLTSTPRKSKNDSSCCDLFGDDGDDDDLLCAIAEEVENRYVTSNTTKLDDDDVFFQPEVLAFISQIESQAISTQKSTAELVEEKRQAAILKRQQRLREK